MADQNYVPQISNCPPYLPNPSLGQAQAIDAGLEDIINQSADQIKAQSDGRDYSNLKGISYRCQILETPNYFIKAKTNDGKFIHLKINVPADLKPILRAIQHDKTESDEIEEFH